MASNAAQRYARAVYELAKESGTLDEWQRDLEVLAALVDDPVTGTYLESPKVREAERIALVDKALEGGLEQSQRLAHLLVQRQRLPFAPEMLDLFKEMRLTDEGISTADVTTAVELDEASQRSIDNQLASLIGNKVQVTYHVDPAIIGGLVARVGDTLIDGSVSGQLRRMRDRLSLAS